MYSVILLAALAGNSETPAWHLKKAYAVNAYGNEVLALADAYATQIMRLKS